MSGYLKLEPQAILFEYSDAGKPHLEGASSGLDFNLTTSGALALVALSLEGPVGIDCEQVRDCTNVIAIARRMFTRKAASRIAKAAPENRMEQFFVAWTALEAKVKADGRGLFGGGEPAVLQVRHCAPEPGFIAAVARGRLPPAEEWATLELSTD